MTSGQSSSSESGNGLCHRCPLSQQRSSEDHRRFFALISAAFDQWPEGADFTPDNAEHLRAWLLCKANYRKTTMIETDEPAATVVAIEAAFRAADTYAFVRPYGDGVAVYSPKSLRFDKTDQKAFNAVRDEVSSIIESVIGVTAEQLLREKAA